MSADLLTDLGYLILGVVVGAMIGWEICAMKYTREARRLLRKYHRDEENRP